MKKDFIIDIGMHKGEDTGYYLMRGYNVLAVDADPAMIELAKKNFKNEYQKGQLQLLNAAISDKDGGTVTFNLSENTLWNSLKENIADRANLGKNAITVPTRTLTSLVAEYGAPYYCKIDIEGYDEVALQTLKTATELPEYISVESECVAEGETISDEQALATLYRLKELGYSRFKLVDQTSLRVLNPDEDLHTSSENILKFQKSNLALKVLRKVQSSLGMRGDISQDNLNVRKDLEKQFNYFFSVGSSGPFGEDLAGNWLDFENAKKTLLKHRADYFKLENAVSYGFWCDWHATK